MPRGRTLAGTRTTDAAAVDAIIPPQGKDRFAAGAQCRKRLESRRSRMSRSTPQRCVSRTPGREDHKPRFEIPGPSRGRRGQLRQPDAGPPESRTPRIEIPRPSRGPDAGKVEEDEIPGRGDAGPLRQPELGLPKAACRGSRFPGLPEVPTRFSCVSRTLGLPKAACRGSNSRASRGADAGQLPTGRSASRKPHAAVRDSWAVPRSRRGSATSAGRSASRKPHAAVRDSRAVPRFRRGSVAAGGRTVSRSQTCARISATRCAGEQRLDSYVRAQCAIAACGTFETSASGGSSAPIRSSTRPERSSSAPPRKAPRRAEPRWNGQIEAPHGLNSAGRHRPVEFWFAAGRWRSQTAGGGNSRSRGRGRN